MIAITAAVAGCSGNKHTAADDAVHAPHRDGSAVVAPVDVPASTGEVAIRVLWKAATPAARRSPGLTPCHTPRAASVAPTTLFGIPEALVVVEGTGTVPAEARIRFSDCTLSPRLVVGGTLIVDTALDRPVKLALSKHGDVAHLDGLAAGPPRAIQLPIAGHAVAVSLDPGGVYRLSVDGDGDFEPAWIVAAPAMITDGSGLATVKEPVGPHAVTAWLPPRGGQPAKLVTSSVAVVADQLVEHAIDL